jgi:hypothetical protein
MEAERELVCLLWIHSALRPSTRIDRDHRRCNLQATLVNPYVWRSSACGSGAAVRVAATRARTLHGHYILTAACLCPSAEATTISSIFFIFCTHS